MSKILCRLSRVLAVRMLKKALYAYYLHNIVGAERADG